jgi:hypothetical protein
VLQIEVFWCILAGWNMTPEEEAIFERAQAMRRDAKQV